MPTSSLLCSLPFFRGLDQATLDRLASRVHERRVARGRRLYHEGEPCEGFFAVVSGVMNVVKLGPEGRVLILETIRPGEYFALVPAVDGGTYLASAEAREDSVVVLVPRAVLLELMAGQPSVGLAVSQAMAKRLRHLTAQLTSSAFQDVRERVASYLVRELSERGSTDADGTVTVELDAPQAELAQRLGTVREVLARTFRSFRQEQLIEQSGRRIAVLAPLALREIARAGI